MNSILKRLFNVISLLIAVPFVLLGKIFDRFGCYVDVSLFLAGFPFVLGKQVRYWFYKFTLESLGNNVTFMPGSFCQYTNTCIGSNVIVGIYTALGECTIGDYVMIGGFVNVLSGTKQHVLAKSDIPMMKLPGGSRSSITIGSNVWIGSNTVIAASICNDSCIGAGALIVKDAVKPGIYVSAASSYLRPLPELHI